MRKTASKKPDPKKPEPIKDPKIPKTESLKSKPSETISSTKYPGRFSRKATNKEAKQYDFITARGIKRRTTSVSESIALILRTSLGGGLLTVHVSVMKYGTWSAMSLNCILGLILGYCMYMLARSAQAMFGRTKVPSMTYEELAEAAMLLAPWPRIRKFSMLFRNVIIAMKLITLFSCCYVYQVLMARIIKQLADETVTIDDTITPTLRAYAVALVVPIMCICMLVRKLSYLAPFSMVADAVFVLITLSTAYYGIKSKIRSLHKLSSSKNRIGIVQYIGTFVFSVEGVCTTLIIEGNMTNPKRIGFVISVGMFIVVLMTTIVGFFGYWGFAEQCTSPITVNFPWTPFPIMLKAFTAVTLLVTYALNFWLPFDLFWYITKPRIHPSRCEIWENVYRVSFVILITGLAGLLPNVRNSVEVIGCSLLTWLGIVFPAFIDLLVVWEDPGLGKLKWRLLTDACMIVSGIIISIVGTIISSMGFVDHFYYGLVE